MKALARAALSAVLALAICGLGGPPARAADTLVSVPDAAFRSCIQKALTYEDLDTDLTAGNLALLDKVSCGSAAVPITDLTGAEHLSNVSTLIVYGSAVTDLAPITGLAKLSNLQVQSTKAYDLAPLTSLPSLTKLMVAIQEGTDPAPFSALGALTQLYIYTGLTHLPKLHIPSAVHDLLLVGSKLTDLGEVTGGAGLSLLAVIAEPLTNLHGIEALTSLEELSCTQSELSDLSAISGLTRLSRLTLYHDRISDIAPLRQLTQLSELNLNMNQVTDLSPLAGLSQLTRLYASGNQLTTLGPVGGLSKLTRGEFPSNHLTSVEALIGAPLQTLDLSDNEISDLGPLSAVTSDATVNVERNHVKDLSPLTDTATVSAHTQTVAFPDTAAGVPIDLGIRGVVGNHLCPSFVPDAACTNGAVTYPESRTYRANLYDEHSGLSFAFTQHAGPDRAFRATQAPKIDKELLVGSSVTPVIANWSPFAESFDFEWLRDGAPATGPGLDSGQLNVTVADLGHRFVVCVTGHADGFVPARRCSNTGTVVAGIFHYPSYPPLRGTATTDELLSVDESLWDQGVTLTYQWQKNRRNIRGATKPTFQVRASDVGDSIRAVVKGSKQGYRTMSLPSQPVRPKKAHFVAAVPLVTGVATVGQRLTAAAGTWVPASAHLTYRWYRNGKAITHATKAGYLLTAKDRGKAIKVRVTATRAGYVTKRVYSLSTAAIA